MKSSDKTKGLNITREEFNKLNSEDKILKISEGLILPPGKSKEKVLASLLTDLGDYSKTRGVRIGRVIQSIAAILIFVIGIYSINKYFLHDKITTQFAEQTEITLPDGSEVFLNAGSKIKWNKKKFSENRQLVLKGEAFFDVKNGNEFFIKTQNGIIEVLGTQLNVFSRQNSFKVSCLSGKVKVLAGDNELILLPGEVSELTSDGLKKVNSYNIENTILWKQGVFYFEDQPLVSIFEEIERQFNVSINYESIEGRLITVSFPNKDLNEALDIVCIPMGLKYEIQKNRKIFIFNKQD